MADAGTRLGTGRRLVLIATENSLDCLVTYLGRAARRACPPCWHPATGSSTWTGSSQAYDPDVVAGRGDSGLAGRPHVVRERRTTCTPDLALLLTTSGSTGSPKLVRLSHENLDSNAAAIAESLGVRPSDRAITSLPLHYCYGLSVVHSHLTSGPALC